MADLTLVTGANGFLGGRAVELLASRGQQVRALVRRGAKTPALDGLGVEILRVDTTSAADLESALKGVDLVINCAGKSADWGPWADFLEANVSFVERLLKAAEAAGVRRVVHVSTTDVYGYPVVPAAEEPGPKDIGLPYNRSKGMGDKLALGFNGKQRLQVTVARPVTIFGPRSKDWVAEIGRLLLSGDMVTVDGGETPAGLVYVDDVVDALIALGAAEGAPGKAFNVRDSSRMSWRSYLDILADGIGSKRVSTNLPGRVALAVGRLMEAAYGLVRTSKRPLLTRHAVYLMARDQAYPIDRLQKLVGSSPAVGVDEGIKRTLAWLDSAEGRREVPR